MKVKVVTSIDCKEFSDFWDLYESSFPTIEKRILKSQEKLFENKSFHLDTYYKEDSFIGFISYWEFEGYIYLEHFAINDLLRSKGYGKKVLSNLIQNTDKIILLEIDPIVDEVSQNRLYFYESLGFIMNDFDYRVQSYQNKAKLYELIIMSYGRRISQMELDTFRYDFQNVIL